MTASNNNGLPRVLVMSLPKSGTHVLNSTLAQFPELKRKRGLWLNSKMALHPLNLVPIPGAAKWILGIQRPRSVKSVAVKLSLWRLRQGCYGSGHVPYQEPFRDWLVDADIKGIVIVRDPRDVMLSSVYYALDRRDHFLSSTLRKESSLVEQMRIILNGGMTTDGVPFNGLGGQLDLIEGWLEESCVMTVRFEEIIGGQGEGSAETQRRVITRLSEFIGLPLNDEQASEYGRRMFGKGKTFRKGKIGGWKDAFTPELEKEFRDVIGPRLERLGYSW